MLMLEHDHSKRSSGIELSGKPMMFKSSDNWISHTHLIKAQQPKIDAGGPEKLIYFFFQASQHTKQKKKIVRKSAHKVLA